MNARYNAICFRGPHTYAVLVTPKGEVRGKIPQSLKALFTSHNIGSRFTVSLGTPTDVGLTVEADILSATKA